MLGVKTTKRLQVRTEGTSQEQHVCEVQLTKCFSLAYASGCVAAPAASKCAGSCSAKAQHAVMPVNNSRNHGLDIKASGMEGP